MCRPSLITTTENKRGRDGRGDGVSKRSRIDDRQPMIEDRWRPNDSPPRHQIDGKTKHTHPKKNDHFLILHLSSIISQQNPGIGKGDHLKEVVLERIGINEEGTHQWLPAAAGEMLIRTREKERRKETKARVQVVIEDGEGVLHPAPQVRVVAVVVAAVVEAHLLPLHRRHLIKMQRRGRVVAGTYNHK